MYRSCFNFLHYWFDSSNRKPLVIRGARQVGKTWLARYLAENRSKKLIEINFETMPQAARFFASNNPQQILRELSAAMDLEIIPSQSLLFLDEIQAAPEILAKLRWFYEGMPELPVIATGSLLEFLLEDYPYSMPVGRISYMYLEPLSFEEFLLALQKATSVDYFKKYRLGQDISAPLHEQWIKLFKEYLIVGGLPEAVKQWVATRSQKDLALIHNNLLTTYRDDFNRYKGRLNVNYLEETMQAIPLLLGEKFVFKKVNPSVQTAPLKQSLSLLSKAHVCTKVLGTDANGVPLGAEIQHKYMKVIFLDVGLCTASLKLSLQKIEDIREINLINSGGIAEQVAGQLLKTIDEFFIEPELYYWQREGKWSKAEIDYVIQHGNTVVPIEVKAGITARLQSLHLFMAEKKLNKAVRINSGPPTINDVIIKDYQGNLIQYKLLSIPFYLIGQLHRLIDEI